MQKDFNLMQSNADLSLFFFILKYFTKNINISIKIVSLFPLIWKYEDKTYLFVLFNALEKSLFCINQYVCALEKTQVVEKNTIFFVFFVF